MKKVDLIVIIPVGPTTNLDFLLDTIESVKFYCGKNQKIILTNDSQKQIKLNTKKLDIDVVDLDKPMGKQSGLYFSLCKGMQFALAHYEFKTLLRMDDDALITGLEPEKEAITYFKNHPEVGMLGSYRVDWKNEPRSFVPPKKQILLETSLIWKIYNLLRNRKTNSILPVLSDAQANGYELGEHVLGGVYFMSNRLLQELDAKRRLPAMNFLGSKLEEDHIFAMSTYSVNMKIADFVTSNYPMCLKWKGMPTSPEEIHALGKKVIHSTRYFNELNEADVRQLFKSFRDKSSH